MPLPAALIPLISAGTGAGVGLIKYLRDKEEQHKDAKLNAMQRLTAPWTGNSVQEVKRANLLQSIWDGVSGGAAMGQNIMKAGGGKDTTTGAEAGAGEAGATAAAGGGLPIGREAEEAPSHSIRMQDRRPDMSVAMNELDDPMPNIMQNPKMRNAWMILGNRRELG